MDLTIRPAAAADFAAFRAVAGNALGFEAHAEDTPHTAAYFEFPRSVAAFDGSRLVGTLGCYTMTVSVPGGTMRMGGTSFVGVLATHRRRGILRTMMERHLEDVRAHDEPVVGLWASESVIYGRFGYGAAAYSSEIGIDRVHAHFRGADRGGTLRMLDAEEAAALLPSIYERVRPTIPGMLGRSAAWWANRRLYDPPHRRGGASALQYVVVKDGGVAHGYAQYRRVGPPFSSTPQKIAVVEMMAANDAAEAALWRFLCRIDLIGRIEAWNRPVDDTLPWLVEDPRRVDQKQRDTLWLRIMDVKRALEARRYAVDGRIVLAVDDPRFAANSGRFALEAGRDGARCVATDAPADIALPVDMLGAVFLGANRFQTLARAGRLSGDAAALARADAMFASPRAAWCPEIF